MVSSVRPAHRATCVIDQLENRNLFAATSLQIDYAHTFKVTDRTNNYESQIMQLSNSSLLLRWAVSPDNSILTYETYFKIVPTSSSFNRGNVLRLNNYFTPLMQLSDGSILLKDLHNTYYKLLISGKLDNQFGDHGSLSPDYGYQRIVESEGNLVGYALMDDSHEFITSIFNLNGKLKSQVTSVPGDTDYHTLPYIFPDGDALIQTQGAGYRRLNSDGKLDQTFGENGILNLNSNLRYRRWAKKQVWKEITEDGEIIVHRPGFVPTLSGSPEAGSENGTITFRVETGQSFTDSVATYTTSDFVHTPNYRATTLAMVYGSDGQPRSFHPSDPKWTQDGYDIEQPIGDEGGPGALYATIQLASGQTFTFDPGTLDARFNLYQAGGPVSDGHGGFYFLGARYDENEPGYSSVWAIHTVPFISTISGRVFADKNLDGVRQVGEKLLIGEQVYIDENRNNRYDEEELTTVTDAKGHYQFNGLYKGTYKVRVVPPTGKHVTTNTFSTGSITLKLGQSKWGENGVGV